MQITNKKLQQKFKNFLEGEPITWELARIYYSQNGGYLRKTGDQKTGIALSQSDGHIVISTLKLLHPEDEDKPLKCRETNYFKLAVNKKSEVYHKTQALLEYAAHTQHTQNTSKKEPGNMYK